MFQLEWLGLACTSLLLKEPPANTAQKWSVNVDNEIICVLLEGKGTGRIPSLLHCCWRPAHFQLCPAGRVLPRLV